MKVVHKYVLKAHEQQEVVVPENATPLHVMAQRENIVLYMLVDPERPKVPRKVMILGTGWPTKKEPVGYVGTVVTEISLIWHVFVEPCPVSMMRLEGVRW